MEQQSEKTNYRASIVGKIDGKLRLFSELSRSEECDYQHNNDDDDDGGKTVLCYCIEIV